MPFQRVPVVTQCNYRAVSEQFQSSSQMSSKMIQSDLRADLEFECRFSVFQWLNSAVLAQFRCGSGGTVGT